MTQSATHEQKQIPQGKNRSTAGENLGNGLPENLQSTLILLVEYCGVADQEVISVASYTRLHSVAPENGEYMQFDYEKVGTIALSCRCEEECQLLRTVLRLRVSP
jgi:hypothetical protein